MRFNSKQNPTQMFTVLFVKYMQPLNTQTVEVNREEIVAPNPSITVI